MRTQPLKSNSQLPPFPYKKILLTLFLTLITLTWIGIDSINRFEKSKYNLEENQSLILGGSLIELDSIATLSLSMAASTGDVAWLKRFKYYDAMVDDHINKISLLKMPSNFKNVLKKIDILNEKLDVIENQTLNFIAQNKLPEAQNVLNSNNYNNYKISYIHEIGQLMNLVQQTAVQSYYDDKRKIYLAFSFIIITFLFTILVWTLAHDSIMKWKRIITDALQSQLEYSKELEESRLLLEQRVHTRTQELDERNKYLYLALANMLILQNNLIDSEKMAVVGHLSAGIAHEINNPLSFVLSNIDTLRNRLTTISRLFDMYRNLLNELHKLNIPTAEETISTINVYIEKNKVSAMVEDFNDIINESTDGLTRIKKIVSNLSALSNLNKECMTNTNINDCINQAVEIVWHELKYNIELHRHLDDLPMILGAPKQLQLAFMNILLNAVQSIKEKGEITIVSRVTGTDILVTITDNGCGIDPENLSKIFQPFFTDKPIGIGQGLGLTIAYTIFQLHSGKLMVESKLGVGSTFTITIPIMG